MADDANPGTGQARRTIVLIVRLWNEPAGDGRAVLRGTVAELGGAMLGAFASLPSLAALIQRYLAGDANG